MYANVHYHPESVLSTQRICSEAVPWLNDNRGPEIVVSISILLALATIAVILRVMSRRMSKLKFGIDDWLIALALVGHPFRTLAV